MKETELQELERALQAASPEPWRANNDAYVCRVMDLNDCVVVTDDSGSDLDTAAIAALRNKAPDLISALREARRLLGEARDHLVGRALCDESCETLRSIRAFLGERSDREQSEPSSPLDPGEQKT